jgi:hypothetical protein
MTTTGWAAGPETEAFHLGVQEASGDIGMTYDNDPESPRSVAYDVGRTVGELLEPWRSRLAAAPELYVALRLYARLHDGLSDMIEVGRLQENDIPDDYEWLVKSLAEHGTQLNAALAKAEGRTHERRGEDVDPLAFDEGAECENAARELGEGEDVDQNDLQGTEGQDRKSYGDTQDRENYMLDNEDSE